MVAYRRLKTEQIAAIRCASRLGIAVRAIAADQKVSRGAVLYWVHKTGEKEPNSLPAPCARSRRSVKARRELIRRLASEKVVVKNRERRKYHGCLALREALRQNHGITVCPDTIRKDLHALGWKCYSRTKTTHRSDADMAARKAFAKAWRRTVPRRLVFTDEKTFTCLDYTYGWEWAPTKNDVTRQDNSSCFQDTVYVWGAIGHNFRHLVVIRKTKASQRATQKRNHEERDESEKFTTRTYINRCLAGTVVEHLTDRRNCVRGSRLVLQADNHRSHFSREAIRYMDGKGIHYMHDWPARSPDLNPIENLWAYLQRKVSMRVPQDADELEAAILAEWNALTDEQVNEYVKSFRGKCERVFDRDGNPA